jgi:tRNA pseudouridine32 synthase / 23S rRNA pseudouridine746 synthase
VKGDALDIIYLDADCVVVVKPSGLLSVPGRGEDGVNCLFTQVKKVFADAQVVHRLDMATSGLMLFARSPQAQRKLSIAFAQREVHKRYVAIVQGRLMEHDGEINLPLIADWPNRPKQRVDKAVGKPSLTRFRVLEELELGTFKDDTALPLHTTRLELEPITGRSHQLRVHLMAHGHPILGDALYAPPQVQAAAPRLMLHATHLRFMHPVSGAWVDVASVAPF